MVKSVTRSNIFLMVKKKMKCLKFISTDISVFFLRPFSEYKNLYMLHLQCQKLKNGCNSESEDFKALWKFA